jgi:hypothetical protein
VRSAVSRGGVRFSAWEPEASENILGPYSPPLAPSSQGSMPCTRISVSAENISVGGCSTYLLDLDNWDSPIPTYFDVEDIMGVRTCAHS